MAGKNRLLAKILGNNEGVITPDSDTLAIAVTKNIPTAVGITVYSSIDDLPSTASTGEKALVTLTNTLYLYNSGWYKIALINNFNPQWVTQPAATYDLAINSTPTVITMLATDSDDVPIRYVATTDSGFNSIATVSHDSDKHNVFTIIPTDSENGAATGGTGTITFKATDGVNQVQQVSTFSLSFGPDWSVAPTESKLVASDPQVSDLFGFSVSISSDGSYAIVGANREDTGGTDAGAAYIFTRSGSTWTQQQKITASDIEASDSFGNSVSISSDGSYAIVGAPQEDTGASSAGAAYIFSRSGSTWTQQQKIQASDPEATDYFGVSVSISSDGSYAIIGAQYEDTGGSNTGSAYIFSRSGSTWTQQQKIQTSDIQAGDLFGYSVSINSDGTYAIVGAAYEDTGGSSAGAAYVFSRSGSTWTQQQKIQASDIQASDNFGISVSISSDGSYAIVSTPYEDTGGGDAGAAYIFSRSGSTWTQQQKIQASDAQAGDNFGQSVSISSDGSYAIIGAHREDGAITDAGAAYIFSRSGSTWTQERKITASDAQASDFFGFSVSISSDGSYAIVSAYGEDGGAGDTITAAGAAYIYEAG